ncbi:MAG: TIM barrel protein [Flavisolibacter sp.]
MIQSKLVILPLKNIIPLRNYSITSRRNFLKASAFVPFIFNGFGKDNFKKKQLLSFSTLGCPEWNFEKILQFAADHHYDGIEIRGIRGQLDLTKCPEFATPAQISISKKKIEQRRLKIVNLGSSTELHHADKEIRRKHLEDGKRFLELAAELNCPFLRVFPNNLPNTMERSKVMDLIIKGMDELGTYGKKLNVGVLLETHGDAVKTEEIRTIMEATKNAHTGLVWDVVNMWTVTKEPPKQVYEQLRDYIRHTHIKDCWVVDGKINYVFLGAGETPIFEAIDILNSNGYKGYYSFEWEKLWHPEIADPELALADYPIKMKKHFGNLRD